MLSVVSVTSRANHSYTHRKLYIHFAGFEGFGIGAKKAGETPRLTNGYQEWVSCYKIVEIAEHG